MAMERIAGRPLRVLVVDDEYDIVDATRLCLEASGYVVLSAYDGVRALEILESETPDLIILDVAMPGLNGWDTLRQIQEKEKLRGVPVMMLTAMDELPHVATAVRLGCASYYTKPVTDWDDFGAVVSRLLEAQCAR